MDVRCERCRAQYVFDDEQVTPQGLTVQCTNCGHVFRVKKKELVVTVPIRPEDVTEVPFMARPAVPRPAGLAEPAAPRSPVAAEPAAPRPAVSAEPAAPRPAVSAEPAAPRPAVPAPEQGWSIRQAGGATLSFTELTTLQKWIVERKVTREDEVSQGDEAWVRLGTIAELGSFFDVVEAADRGRRPPPSIRPGGTDFYPPPPFPLPPQAQPAPPAPAPAPAPAAAAPAPAPARPPAPTAELDAEELAAVGGRKGGRPRLVAGLLLLVALLAAGYAFGPALLGREPAPAPAPVVAPPPAPPAPEPVAVPLNIELKAPPPEAEVAPGPRPEERPAPATPPEPVVAPPPPQAPEPVVAAAPARPASAAALLAQARRHREKGEIVKALDLYGKVAAAEPANVDAQTGRGLCYFELGQYAPAEVSFQRALQLDLDHPDAIMGLAETYRQQGKKTEALGLFERYLAVHPEGEEAAVARYAISQLKE